MSKFFYKWQDQPSWISNEVASCVRLNLLERTGGRSHSIQSFGFCPWLQSLWFPCRALQGSSAAFPGQLLSPRVLTAQLARRPPFSFILRLYALFSSQLPVFIKLTQPSCCLLIWLKPNSRPENYFKGREQEVGGRYLMLLVSFP